MSEACLLDTHVLLWAVAEPRRLSPAVRSLIEKRRYAVSVASLWELINKKGRPNSPVGDPGLWWERYVVQSAASVLPIRAAHVLYLERLPWHHRDPYDRILIAQAVVEQMTLVTADAEIAKYGISVKWAAK